MAMRQQDSPNFSDPQADMGRLVASLAYFLDRGLAQQMSPYDLLPLDVQLLVICREMGECTATQLATLLPVDAARISRLVNTLVEKDVLRRRRLRSDRRVVMLSLSAPGEDLTAEVAQRIQDYYSRVTEGISEEDMRVFTDAALKIIANYRAMEGA